MNCKRTACAMLVAALPLTAHAANWLQLQGTEGKNTPAYKFWGFVQPTYVYNFGDPVTGLAGAPAITAYNGRDALFNLVGPAQKDESKFQFNRARLGVRGAINDKINYFLLAELGDNGLTREDDVVLSDWSVTFNHLPRARIRVGQFKLPLGEEALQAVQVMDYVNFTSVTDGLLLERRVRPNAPAAGRSFNVAPGLNAARVVDSVGGFRDIGVQVFDWWQGAGQWEYAYAVMASQGDGINIIGDDYGKWDVSGRLQAAYVFGGKGPRRQDAVMYAWYQTGERRFAGDDYDRTRYGLGANARRGKWRAGGEYLAGKGMIFNGVNPPFKDAGTPGFQPTAVVGLDNDNEADGFYLDAGYKVLPKLELDVRYDQYNRLTNSAPDERTFKTWTVGAQYFFKPTLRLGLNYEFRSLDVANPGAIANPVQRANAQTIADAMDDRVSLQLTWIF